MQEEKLNEQGQNLNAFLENYDPGNYDRPSFTLDIAIMTAHKKLLMIRRKNHPNIGKWGLPGGFLEMEESLYDGAVRELREETNVEGITLFSLGVFASPKRDPRTRIITQAFCALTKEENLSICAGDDAAEARLFNFSCQSLGKKKIPALRSHYPLAIDLPCTAYGQPLPERAESYLLKLEADEIALSAEFALHEGNAILVDTPALPGSEPIAGDHGLIIATAILKCFPELL